MVIVWRLRGNIIRTAPCWVVWHNVHSQQHTHMSSSYRSSRLGLSHREPYAVHRGGCLEVYYCNMVEWSWWWDSGFIWKTYNVLSGTLCLCTTNTSSEYPGQVCVSRPRSQSVYMFVGSLPMTETQSRCGASRRIVSVQNCSFSVEYSVYQFLTFCWGHCVPGDILTSWHCYNDCPWHVSCVTAIMTVHDTCRVSLL